MKPSYILTRALLFVYLLTSSCFTIKPVTLKKVDQFTTSKNNSAPSLSFQLVFHNPNSFAITVSKVESIGSLNSQSIFDISIPANIRTLARNDFSIPVTASLAGIKLEQLLGTGLHILFNNESVPVSIKGKVKLRKFIFTKTFQFEFTQPIDKAQLKKIF